MRASISISFTLVLGLAASAAGANTAFQFMKENFTIYEVVVESGGAVEEAPGIYSLDDRGNSRLVVPGRVIGANRNFPGIIAYGPQTSSRSSAHDAIAVVDGEIVIFNRYTDPKKASASSVILGDKLRGVELIDVLTGLPVTLPKIEDAQSLVVRSGTYLPESTTLGMGGHFIMMSIQAPSHLGDGLTFGFVLENVRTGRPRIMGGRALLLSHSFSSRETLERLLVHQAPSNMGALGRLEAKLQIYVPSMIARFKTQIENKSTSPVVKNWLDHIERFETYVREGIRSTSKVDTQQMALGIPTFDLFTRRESLPMSPIETITEDQQSVIGQIFNHVSSDFGIVQAAESELQAVPVGKNGVMRFIHTKAAEHRQIAHLPVDRDAKTGRHRFLTQHEDEVSYHNASAKSFILFSGRSAYLMARPMTSGPKDAYVTLQIKNPVLSPEDKIEFFRRPMQVNGRNGSALIIWRKKFTYADNLRGKKEERADLHALLIDEAEGMQIVGGAQQLYDGTSPLTFEEAKMRLVEDNGRILFDKTTPVRGAKRYETGDQFADESGLTTSARFKTTPYEEVSREGGKPGKQTWLRALLDQTIVQDVLAFREYNETGARETVSGFYLESPPTTEEGRRQTETLIKGIPLNRYTGKLNDFPSYTLLAKSLYQPWGGSGTGPNVALTIIPFDPQGEPRAVHNGEPIGKKKKKQMEEDQREFRLAVLLSPDRIGLTKSFQPVLRNLRVPRPYKQLQFAQVVQGTKNRANEVSVLLFFRADPKVPDSIDEVMIATANLSWNNTLVSDPFTVQMASSFETLHRGLVIPSAVHSHLRVDAEGSYYWVQDPTGDRQSPQYRVVKLTAPTAVVRSSSGHGNLREPDEIRETDVGYVGGKRAVGGRWEILTTHGLSDAVPGLRDQSDKRVTRANKKRTGRKGDETPSPTPKALPSLGDGAAEQQLLTAFESKLDELATANGPHQLRRPRIFVVHPSLKEKFKWSLYTKLALDSGPFSMQNSKLRFFNANSSLDDVEVAEELQYIRETTQEKARILYVEQDQLRPNGSLNMRKYDLPEDDDQTDEAKRDELPFPLDEPAARPNMMVLLASGGQAKSLKGFDKITDRQTPVPMVSLVTPEEWREIQKDQAAEIQSGVLDNVTVDYDYLTTDWTMWSPRTQDKADEDVKRLAKRPYRSEEMRVFPTLERVLNQAARGETPGKKTLILVPEELKQLVQTLVIVRWATQEPSSGDWSYRNAKLALSRVGTMNMRNQAAVLDNFRAMRGAASSRHAVLYADLDTIAKVRRPDQDSDSRPIYRLKDPVQAGTNAMFGEYDQKPKEDGEKAPEDEDLAEHDNDEGDEQARYMFSHDAELEELREDGTTVEKVNMHIAQTTAAIEQLNYAIDEYSRAQRARDTAEYAEMVTELADRTQLRKEMIEIKRQIEEYQAELAPEDRDQPSAPRDPAPHLMWLIAGEGQQIQPSPKAGWSLSQAIDPKITTIMIGTPEELEKIETDLQGEAKYFNLRKEFDVISLEAPSEDTKVKLVQQLFERPEVLQMGLNFKLKRDNGHDPREQLIYHFINRIDELAYDQKISKTNAFIRAYLALQHHLVDDAELYAHRTVSEKFIERLFTKVFPMPLNREILEPNDPLNRLANEDQAVRDLTQAGVEGSPDLKRRVFDNMLSQTRPTDTSRPIPNSQIFFGNTSTGKTFFLERLFRMFGFTEYQSSRSNNEDADYIMIKVSKITAEDTNSPDFISIKDTLENISDLLAQPKGARAHIVFDDYHTAQSKDVREKLYQFIRGLLESPNGMYVAQRKSDGRRVEIPVQNLNLWMTINPQADEMARRRFIKQGLSGLELLKREVLSAMSGDNFTFEESILARFGDIIDFDKFPRSAKVPELVKRVRQNQIPGGQMVLVDPQVIFNLIDKYPEAHARELLSPATSALTQIPRDVEEGPIYLVADKNGGPLTRESASSGGVSQQELSKAVRSSTRVETIRPNDPRALESFMGFMMHNFRLQMFNQVVLEASQNDLLRLPNPKNKNLMKANFMLGMASHVLENGRLPLSEISIRHEQFGFYTRVQQQELMRRHEEVKEANRGKVYFPVEFDIRRRHNSENLDTFFSGIGTGVAERRTRRDVLAETVGRLEVVLQRAMAHYLRIPSADELLRIGSWKENEIKVWFRDLPEDEPEADFELLRVELVELFKDFHQRLNGVDLDPEEVTNLDFYTQVRLFAFALDKAVTRLPWGQIGNFVINVAAQSSDSSLGARTSYRNYVSKQQLSAFAIGTPEFMGDMLESAMNENNHERTAADLERLKSSFKKACETLLGSAGGAK